MPFNNIITKGSVQYIGYGGPAPLAIIFWYEQGESEPLCKTVCYDEAEVIAMYKRHTTDGDFYNKLEPSVQLVDRNESMQRVA